MLLLLTVDSAVNNLQIFRLSKANSYINVSCTIHVPSFTAMTTQATFPTASRHHSLCIHHYPSTHNAFNWPNYHDSFRHTIRHAQTLALCASCGAIYSPAQIFVFLFASFLTSMRNPWGYNRPAQGNLDINEQNECLHSMFAVKDFSKDHSASHFVASISSAR